MTGKHKTNRVASLLENEYKKIACKFNENIFNFAKTKHSILLFKSHSMNLNFSLPRKKRLKKICLDKLVFLQFQYPLPLFGFNATIQ